MNNHIIFDLDGTLLDSMYVWKDVGANFLREHHITPSAHLRDILKKQTLPETAQYFKNTYNIPFTADQIVEEIIQMVANQYRDHVQLKPFVLEYLKVQQKQGTKMCILTASEATYIQTAIDRLEIAPYFEFIMTCTEAGFNKNTPTVYEFAMQRLGGTKDTTAVFEDALYAVKAAKEGGFYVVAVQDDITENDTPMIQSLCDKYIYSYQELLSE